MSREAYLNEMLPYAMQASNSLGIDPNLILAQWAHETGYGTSNVSQNNNHGGIKYTGRSPYQAGKANGHATYSSVDQFVKDYVRVMNLSYYDKVRGASSVQDTIEALHRSPYATDPSYGSKVEKHFGIVSKLMGDTLPGVSLEKYKQQAESLDQDGLIKYAGVGLLVLAVAKSLD